MRSSKRQSPQINAGSTADIAFLLLIFFLVTAMIPNDTGFNRKLPAECIDCKSEIHQRNILEIKVNSKNELFVENEVVSIDELKDITKNFLDNNGDTSCAYCNGSNDVNSSDNPQKAVVSLSNDKQTSYEFYIKVQDEITKAYYELRSHYSETILNKPSNLLTKADIKNLREAYPFILSEAELKN